MRTDISSRWSRYCESNLTREISTVICGGYDGLLQAFRGVGRYSRQKPYARRVLRRMSEIPVIERGKHTMYGTR